MNLISLKTLRRVAVTGEDVPCMVSYTLPFIYHSVSVLFIIGKLDLHKYFFHISLYTHPLQYCFKVLRRTDKNLTKKETKSSQITYGDPSRSNTFPSSTSPFL